VIFYFSRSSWVTIETRTTDASRLLLHNHCYYYFSSHLPSFFSSFCFFFIDFLKINKSSNSSSRQFFFQEKGNSFNVRVKKEREIRLLRFFDLKSPARQSNTCVSASAIDRSREFFFIIIFFLNTKHVLYTGGKLKKKKIADPISTTNVQWIIFYLA
jgi:hypothetical protein